MPVARFFGVERYLSLSLPFQQDLRLNLPIALILQAKHWLCSACREAFRSERVLSVPKNNCFAKGVVTFFHHPLKEYRVFKDGISFTSKLGQRILT